MAIKVTFNGNLYMRPCSWGLPEQFSKLERLASTISRYLQPDNLAIAQLLLLLDKLGVEI